MGFVDWIKNRGQQPAAEQTSQQPSETAKQMYTREAAEEKAKPISQIPPDQQARVDQVKSDMQKATQVQGEASQAPSHSSEDGASPEAMAQKSMSQDKTAPKLSPTSAKDGMRPSDEERSAPAETPSQSQEKSPESSQQRTIPRPPPSWER
jgi:hypothetical protein